MEMLFLHRSTRKEILDNESIETTELDLNLKELHSINKLLGGYKATLAGLENVFRASEKELINVLDIGFGGGDSIRAMSEYAINKQRKVFFYGVDLKADCVAYATKNLDGISNKMLICDDYRNLSSEFLETIDVIHCSLFIHHLTDEEIEKLIRFSYENKCILLINDLHRHPVAFYSIKFLTQLFSRSRLVRNDAPLSVLRGFRKRELRKLFEKSGYSDFSVRWIWAFRYLIFAGK